MLQVEGVATNGYQDVGTIAVILKRFTPLLRNSISAQHLSISYALLCPDGCA